jgi:hypothetical protein
VIRIAGLKFTRAFLNRRPPHFLSCWQCGRGGEDGFDGRKQIFDFVSDSRSTVLRQPIIGITMFAFCIFSQAFDPLLEIADSLQRLSHSIGRIRRRCGGSRIGV